MDIQTIAVVRFQTPPEKPLKGGKVNLQIFQQKVLEKHIQEQIKKQG